MDRAALRDDKVAFAADPVTTGKIKATRPMNGGEFLESLRDGREIYIYGERVKDVTTHPAFRNTSRMVARLYDSLHDPKHKDKLLVPTDTGNGGMTQAYCKAPKTVAE
jgi:4-hydroxyphenylacetate 3-monooxygenase